MKKFDRDKFDLNKFVANLKRSEKERRKRGAKEDNWLDEYEQIARISYFFRDNREKEKAVRTARVEHNNTDSIEPQSNDAPAYQTEAWYQTLVLSERQHYDFLHPYKDAWESEEITDADLSAKAQVSAATISRWRRSLRKQNAPDMDWKKKTRGSA